MIKGDITCKQVHGLAVEQEAAIRSFLQGAVYCWCKNRPHEWFAARDLIGGDNYYWQGTPLYELYRFYLDGNDENSAYAVDEAGKAAGRLLKIVLNDDKRTFETREGFTREYLWVGDVNDGL